MNEHEGIIDYFLESILTEGVGIVLFLIALLIVFSLLYFLTPIRGKFQKKAIITIDTFWILSSVITVFIYIQEINIKTTDIKVESKKDQIKTKTLEAKILIDYNLNQYLEEIIQEKLPYIKTTSDNETIKNIVQSIKKEIIKQSEIGCAVAPSKNQYAYEKLVHLRSLFEQNGSLNKGDIQDVFSHRRDKNTENIRQMLDSFEHKEYILFNNTIDKIYDYIDYKSTTEKEITDLLSKKDYAKHFESIKPYFILLISILLSIRLMKNVIEYDIERLREKEKIQQGNLKDNVKSTD